MDHHFALGVHRATAYLQWLWGGSCVLVGAVAKVTDAARSDVFGQVSTSEWNTRILIIGTGLILIASKLADMALEKWKAFRLLDAESEQGKLRKCLEERDAAVERGKAEVAAVKGQFVAERALWAAQESRLVGQNDWFQGALKDARESERSKGDIIVLQNESLARQSETIARQSDALAALAHRNTEVAIEAARSNQVAIENTRVSVENTRAAIEKIPAAAPPDVVVVAVPGSVPAPGVRHEEGV